MSSARPDGWSRGRVVAAAGAHTGGGRRPLRAPPLRPSAAPNTSPSQLRRPAKTATPRQSWRCVVRVATVVASRVCFSSHRQRSRKTHAESSHADVPVYGLNRAPLIRRLVCTPHTLGATAILLHADVTSIGGISLHLSSSQKENIYQGLSKVCTHDFPRDLSSKCASTTRPNEAAGLKISV